MTSPHHGDVRGRGRPGSPGTPGRTALACHAVRGFAAGVARALTAWLLERL